MKSTGRYLAISIRYDHRKGQTLVQSEEIVECGKLLDHTKYQAGAHYYQVCL